MRIAYSLSLLTLVLAGCSYLSPYSITFTTQDQKVVNPSSDTLDLVLSDEAMAYISTYKCDEKNEVELLPVVTDEMEVTTVHNLNLKVLESEMDGALCKITVTAFDQTTTANAHNSISLYIRTKPVVEEPTAEVPTEETPVDPQQEELVQKENACKESGGTWNSCGSACTDEDEFCIQVCVPKCEYPENESTDTPTEDAGTTSETEESVS
ncbi:MAG: hypothetical protein AAB802_05170 [Patescibacteria group bacterium]